MAAHGDDAPDTHLPGGKHSQQSHRVIAHHGYGGAGLHLGCRRTEPARAHHVGQGQQIRQHLL